MTESDVADDTAQHPDHDAGGRSGGQPPRSQGVYGIGVTADLIGTAVQNLRAYERAGLVLPDRTAGGTRLYSPDDVARLRRVQVLLSQGLNLAGIAQVLDLQDDNQRLRDRLADATEDGGGVSGTAD